MMTRALLSIAVAALAADVSAAPEVLLDTAFGVAGKSFEETNAERGNRIVGSLPEGWSENSGWKSKVVAEYRPVTEEGRSFLRVTQTSGDGLQFRCSLPGLEEKGGYLRLTVSARSVTGGSFGLRYNGPPYATVWSAAPAMDGQWREFTYDFRVDPQPQDMGLYAYLSGNGNMDLQRLSLLRLSDQDLIDEIKAKYPDAGQGNLVRISRFPLEMQSGWSIDRDYSDGTRSRWMAMPMSRGPAARPPCASAPMRASECTARRLQCRGASRPTWSASPYGGTGTAS